MSLVQSPGPTDVVVPAALPTATRGVARGAVKVLRWLGVPVLTVLAASFVLFAAVSAQPGDPARQILGDKATPKQYALLRHQLGLDQPLLERYARWLGRAVRGEFGDSFQFKQSAWGIVEPRLWTTLSLAAYATLLILIAGIGIGIVGGLSSRLGTVVAAVSGVGIAIPAFVAAQLLASVFAVRLHWLPVLGTGHGFTGRIEHLTLPAISLAIGSGAYVTQVTRAAVDEERRRPHVETAIGRGLPRGWILRRHIVRNAAIPITTVSALAVAGLLAGAVVVETAFGLSGIGSLFVQSVGAKDSNVVLAIGLILVVVFVFATTVIDLAQYLLDPRLRAKGGSGR